MTTTCRRGSGRRSSCSTRGVAHRGGPPGRRVQRDAVLHGQVARRPQANCVYKPIAGERPLWDFPRGTLAGREVAAYVVSRAAGWNFVPPTVMRDGPFGPGMCQLWIDLDESVDLIALARRKRLPAAAGDGGLRRGHQQRRPEDRPPAAGRRRAPVRLRPRDLLRRGVQAAHGAVAVARRAAARAAPSRPCAGCRPAWRTAGWPRSSAAPDPRRGQATTAPGSS